ncbi:MAG: hypothetical protein GXP55_09700 [Deltaproteobacteria bacterium]|nr:hypothetical protein [Deltaproteobacteria bacterium]
MSEDEHAKARRCRPLRLERDEVLWFVTCQTNEERFWLHPLVSCGLTPPNRRARRPLEAMQRQAARRIDEMVKDANRWKRPLSPTLDAQSLTRIAKGLVGSAFARAQEKYDVEVYALVVMSSHMHVVLRTRKKNLATFMGYVNARITKAVNRITGRRGGMWAGRYHAQPILDDAAAETLTAYTLRNPVAAGLVERHDDWPGLNLAYGVCDTDELDFEWLDCSAWHRKNRPADLAPFFRNAMLRLSPLPHCTQFEREAYGRMLAEWLVRVEQEEERETSVEPLGVEAVVRADFTDRSENPSFKRRPYAFGSAEAKAKERAMMHLLSQAHAQASQLWRSGDHSVTFPPHTYRPPIMHAA